MKEEVKNNLIIINEESIKEKIYLIRGKKVMLDSDLALIYGYTTKDFNRQVKNNIERFDDDFMFQLTEQEYNCILRCKNFTSIIEYGHGGRRYLPYAFTEEGIYMLMTVLKGEKAINQSKALIRIFKSMKDYLTNNKFLQQDYINNMVFKHDKDIKILVDSFNEIKYKNKINQIFFKGEIFDSHLVLLEIFDESNEEIIIIDNYASKELLKILKGINKKIIIVSSNIDEILKEKYEKQYENITFINNTTIHDRFIIIDRNKLYSCGASFKDLGKKCFAINEMENKKELDRLLDEIFML